MHAHEQCTGHLQNQRKWPLGHCSSFEMKYRPNMSAKHREKLSILWRWKCFLLLSAGEAGQEKEAENAADLEEQRRLTAEEVAAAIRSGEMVCICDDHLPFVTNSLSCTYFLDDLNHLALASYYPAPFSGLGMRLLSCTVGLFHYWLCVLLIFTSWSILICALISALSLLTTLYCACCQPAFLIWWMHLLYWRPFTLCLVFSLSSASLPSASLSPFSLTCSANLFVLHLSGLTGLPAARLVVEGGDTERPSTSLSASHLTFAL